MNPNVVAVPAGTKEIVVQRCHICTNTNQPFLIHRTQTVEAIGGIHGHVDSVGIIDVRSMNAVEEDGLPLVLGYSLRGYI